MEFIDKDLEKYIHQHTSVETEILNQLVQVTADELEYTDMISGRQVGQLLKLLVRIGQYQRVLEVGTFTGYSAIWMADALPAEGEIITLEMNQKYAEISGKYFLREPYNQKIKQITGPALDTITHLEALFDMIFIDADKHQYPDYFLMLKPKLRVGGTLIVDNVLWGGEVIRAHDPKSQAINRMNRMIHEDSDFENVILPVRDGIMLAVKIS